MASSMRRDLGNQYPSACFAVHDTEKLPVDELRVGQHSVLASNAGHTAHSLATVSTYKMPRAISSIALNIAIYAGPTSLCASSSTWLVNERGWACR
jgi:hypothetical protein